MKENKAIETVKTVVCAALLVSLVCLCAIYIFGFGKVQSAELSRSLMASLRHQSSKNEYAKYFDAGCVTPEFIGVSSADGRHIGMFSDTEDAKVGTLYKSFSEYLVSTLGEGGKASGLSGVAGERMWREALSGDNVYMSFCGELPRSMIYFMTFTDSPAGKIGDEFISELIIYPSGEPTEIEGTDINGGKTVSKLYPFSVIARNRHGEYYLFESDLIPSSYLDVYFNRERIFSYNMSGAFSFEFEYADGYAGMTVRTESLSVPEVLVVARDMTESESAISRMTGAFGINYEKSAKYYESDGAVSYIEEGQNIRLSRDGKLVYTVTGSAGGVKVNSGVGGADIYDYVGMAIKLIKESGAGDPADIKLRGVYKNGKNTEVVFGYSCNNISVFNGDSDLLRFEFSGETLVSASLAVYDLQSTKIYSACPRRWYADIYGEEKLGDGRLIPFYTVPGTEKSVGATWLFAKAAEVTE